MTPIAWRLVWRQQRWELAILIGGAMVLALAMAFVAWQMVATREGLEACIGGSPLSPACRSLVDWGNVWTALEPIMVGVATVAPFLVGLFLGAPVLAREVERRTAPMAWSLAPSRRRWLAGRVVPLALVVVVVLLLVGWASDGLQAAAMPGGRGFLGYGSRGPLIAARGLAIFGIGVAVGLATGRVLPAILVTGFIAVAVIGGVEYGRSEVMRAEATWIDIGDDYGATSMVYDSRVRFDDTGELITDEEAFERFPEEFGPAGDGIPPGASRLYLTTPPESYSSFVARESAVLVGVALAAGVLATLLVGSRRPE